MVTKYENIYFPSREISIFKNIEDLPTNPLDWTWETVYNKFTDMSDILPLDYNNEVCIVSTSDGQNGIYAYLSEKIFNVVFLDYLYVYSVRLVVNGISYILDNQTTPSYPIRNYPNTMDKNGKFTIAISYYEEDDELFFWQLTPASTESGTTYLTTTDWHFENTPLANHEVLKEFFFSFVNPTSIDPYAQGGESTTGGGGGRFERTSENIDVPDIPSVDILGTDFVTMYAPSKQQLQNLASYMWDFLNLDNWRKIIADPMDAIIGLNIIPLNIPRGANYEIKVGGIGTEQYAPVVNNQYIKLDCGYCYLNEFYSAYLDYSPYTKIHLYLPYINVVSLSVDEFMGKGIGVKYIVDVLTGSCTAFVSAIENAGTPTNFVAGTSTLLYTFAGNCASPIPLTATSYQSTVNSAIGLVATGATIMTTGGMSAPQAIATGGAVASNVMNAKTDISHGSICAGSNGYTEYQAPYIMIETPRQCVASKQNTFKGYPLYAKRKLSDCSGMTIVDEIHLNVPSATGDEISEIESLLSQGVII